MSQDKKAPQVPDKLEVRKDQSPPAQAASPVATLSSHLDPEPHYLASAICAGTAAWYNFRGNNPRYAAASAGFSLLYLSAGRLLVTGNPRTGYDLGSATSLGLLAWSAGSAATSTPATVLSVVGGMSSVANLIKSYQQRTAKPHEMLER